MTLSLKSKLGAVEVRDEVFLTAVVESLALSTDQNGNMNLLLPSSLPLSLPPTLPPIQFDDSFSDGLGLSLLWHLQGKMTSSYQTGAITLW